VLRDAIKQACAAIDDCFAVVRDENYDEDVHAAIYAALDEADECLRVASGLAHTEE
jgi:hypothetical protein